MATCHLALVWLPPLFAHSVFFPVAWEVDSSHHPPIVARHPVPPFDRTHRPPYNEPPLGGGFSVRRPRRSQVRILPQLPGGRRHGSKDPLAAGRLAYEIPTASSLAENLLHLASVKRSQTVKPTAKLPHSKESPSLLPSRLSGLVGTG